MRDCKAHFFSSDPRLDESDRKTYSRIQQRVVVGIIMKIAPEYVRVYPQIAKEGLRDAYLIVIGARRLDRQTQHNRIDGIQLWRAGVEMYHKEQRSATFEIQAENLTDHVNVINFASLFSGTAVGSPRSVSARLKLTF